MVKLVAHVKCQGVIGSRVFFWWGISHYCQIGCACEISRVIGSRVILGNYLRVITQGFWGSERVGMPERWKCQITVQLVICWPNLVPYPPPLIQVGSMPGCLFSCNLSSPFCYHHWNVSNSDNSLLLLVCDLHLWKSNSYKVSFRNLTLIFRVSKSDKYRCRVLTLALMVLKIDIISCRKMNL